MIAIVSSSSGTGAGAEADDGDDGDDPDVARRFGATAAAVPVRF